MIHAQQQQQLFALTHACQKKDHLIADMERTIHYLNYHLGHKDKQLRDWYNWSKLVQAENARLTDDLSRLLCAKTDAPSGTKKQLQFSEEPKPAAAPSNACVSAGSSMKEEEGATTATL